MWFVRIPEKDHAQKITSLSKPCLYRRFVLRGTLLVLVLLLASCSFRPTAEIPSPHPPTLDEPISTASITLTPQGGFRERPDVPATDAASYPEPVNTATKSTDEYPEPEKTATKSTDEYPEPAASATSASDSYPEPEISLTSTSGAYPEPDRSPTATNAAYPEQQASATPLSPTATTSVPTPTQTEPSPTVTKVQTATITPTKTTSPTPSSTPTPTFTPTPAYSPTPSWTAPPLPESGFKDDFSSKLGENWKWYYPDPTYVSLTASPGYLRIYPLAGGIVDGKPRNLFLANAPQGDFEIRTLLTFKPKSNFQFAGLVIYQDLYNALQFGLGFADCSNPLYCLGRGLYFTSYQQGAPGTQMIASDISEDQPVYIRLTRSGKNYRADYSLDGLNWIQAGTFTNPLTPYWVGILAGQSETGFDATVFSDFDFFNLNLLP